MPFAKTKTWLRTSGTTSACRFVCAACWCCGFTRTSAAKPMVAVASRHPARTRTTWGRAAAIRLPTARPSESCVIESTPLTGEVGDVLAETDDRVACDLENGRVGRGGDVEARFAGAAVLPAEGRRGEPLEPRLAPRGR